MQEMKEIFARIFGPLLLQHYYFTIVKLWREISIEKAYALNGSSYL